MNMSISECYFVLFLTCFFYVFLIDIEIFYHISFIFIVWMVMSKCRKIRNRIVELLRKFACICTPCLCFCVASSGMGKKLLFLKKVLPLDCCMFQVGLITFITCFCALRLSLAVSTSLANKIRLRLSARKKPIVKISYLQEIKSSRDIL